MNFLTIASAIFASICSVSGQSCNTPSGRSGNCVTIQNCAPLLQLVNKPNKSTADFDLLRGSACGFEGQTPKVCCQASAPAQSKKCYTPQWEEGNCVGLYFCPHMAAMLRSPVTKENMQFVERSICQGPEQYSVCCGSGQIPRQDNCAFRLTAAPPDPRPECCGVDAAAGDKIIRGIETGIDQFPWLTLIEYQKGTELKLLCGGSLISGRYVLTAAHCLIGTILQFGTPKNVRLGEYDTSNAGVDSVPADSEALDCADPVVIVPIERSIPHAQYSPQTRKNDIGLIRLAEAAPFTDFVRPICLPTTDVTATSPLSGYQLYVAGWGNTNASRGSSSNIKMHSDLPYVPLKDCQESYDQFGSKISLGQGQLCAGGVANKDSCKGDSGGPLMYEKYENGRKWEIIGVASFGPSLCGIDGIPGVYTKTYEYINWILDNIRYSLTIDGI